MDSEDPKLQKLAEAILAATGEACKDDVPQFMILGILDASKASLIGRARTKVAQGRIHKVPPPKK